jgi:hypothetical protein
MLIEDLTLGAFPFPKYGLKKYTIEIEASEEECKSLLIDAIETQYARHDLTESIYDFAHECIQCLATYGEAPYEVIYFSDDQDVPKAFLLALIIPASFTLTRDGYRQYVPAAEKAEQGLTTQSIELPAENILLFELPHEVKDSYEFMMECLSYFGGAVMPQFAVQDLFKRSIPFSQQDYFKTRKLAIASATKDIGWNARDYGTEYELEFYVWYRQLKFYRFQCVLRNIVIEKLNEGLSRIGKHLGFEAKLSINGLPTVADADRAIERLLAGNARTFLEVLEPFH